MKKDRLIGTFIGIQAFAFPFSFIALGLEYFRISEIRHYFQRFESVQDIFLYWFCWWIGFTIFGAIAVLRQTKNDKK